MACTLYQRNTSLVAGGFDAQHEALCPILFHLPRV
jgi:hypothetical protein